MPAETNKQTYTHLRGTDEYCHKYFHDISISQSHSIRATLQTINVRKITGNLLTIFNYALM